MQKKQTRQIRTDRSVVSAACLALGIAGSACDSEDDTQDDYRFSSSVATLMNFEFQGELLTTPTSWTSRRVETQMLYTVGQLNGDNSVGRLDQLEVTDLTTEDAGDGLTRVRYTAKLPVAWGSRSNLPTSYDFELPARVDTAGLEAFTEAYSEDCVDWSAHDVTPGSMWYYYRPEWWYCNMAEGDTVSFTASVSVSDENTTNKYPEYHKVWEDDELEVVAIFGKYEDGATTDDDAGIEAYNRFAGDVASLFANNSLTSDPSTVPVNPGIAEPDITFRVDLGDGRTARVTALLVDNVRTAPPSFTQRYADLSAEADLVFYSGHAGLGANIRALARMGTTLPGKYQIFFMNGCDTFAYIDSAIQDAKAAANPDDPTGSKYVDMITNAMPSYFRDMSQASIALIRGLATPDNPVNYVDMFDDIPDVQVILVTGEEDNEFEPGFVPTGLTMQESGHLRFRETRVFETPELEPGTYTFRALAGDTQRPADADIFVEINQAPTLRSYACASRGSGTDESCTVTITERSTLFVMVHGYNRRGTQFVLTGAEGAD